MDVGLGLPVGTFGIRISEFRIYIDWEFIWEIFLVGFCVYFYLDLEFVDYILLDLGF